MDLRIIRHVAKPLCSFATLMLRKVTRAVRRRFKHLDYVSITLAWNAAQAATRPSTSTNCGSF